MRQINKIGFLTLVPGVPHIRSQVPGEGSQEECPRSQVLSPAYESWVLGPRWRVPGEGSQVEGPGSQVLHVGSTSWVQGLGSHFSGMPFYRASYRSSHPEVFLEKGVLKICSKFTREHPCWSAISIKLQSISRNHQQHMMKFSNILQYNFLFQILI